MTGLNRVTFVLWILPISTIRFESLDLQEKFGCDGGLKSVDLKLCKEIRTRLSSFSVWLLPEKLSEEDVLPFLCEYLHQVTAVDSPPGGEQEGSTGGDRPPPITPSGDANFHPPSPPSLS